MKKNFVYICLAMIAAIGCQKPAVEADVIASDHGKKWQVNHEMAVHIEAMETDIANFKTGDDLTVLQTRLKNNISELTSKCTMTGQSHDELHKWLLPFIETVNSMEEQGPKAFVENLKVQFENYHRYFESAPDDTI